MNVERRTDDGAEIRARIDDFLNERGLTGAGVVPLTGDASDRRYFRVYIPDDGAQVGAGHTGGLELRSF